MPEYGPESIKVLNLQEGLRERPEMYLGDVGALGAARLIGLAVDVLLALVVNRDGAVCFKSDASLSVYLAGRQAQVVVDYCVDECPDFQRRCKSLLAYSNTLMPDEFALHRSENSPAPMPILRAFSTELVLYRSLDGKVEPVYPADHKAMFAQPGPSQKGSVCAEFRIAQQIDPSALTDDGLKSVLEGDLSVPGLAVSSVKVIHPT
ncbi:hypothetical protein [Halovulum sp. GXIMD14793]